IPAGLQDRVAQSYNHPVYMDFNREHMEKFGVGKYKMIEIPEDLNLYIAYRTDLAEGSEILHSRLRHDFNDGKPEVLAAMREWSSLTDQVREALELRQYEKIPSLLNRNFDLRCEVCAEAVSSKNRRMVEMARKIGASAKFTGSGGAIIGTYQDEAMYQRLKNELKKYQIEVIKPSIVHNMKDAYS
ncbi:MAG: GHMP kinase, partial [Lentisphaeria bacterium]|nr:GHMP kinase [Lentisphaeria bacterium]